jgi:4-hydroxythreonine-4-phosphate dehydrogenase
MKGSCAMPSSSRPLFITLGDPHSINCAALARVLMVREGIMSHPVVLIGSLWQWQHQLSLHQFKTARPLKMISDLSEAVGTSDIYFLDIDEPAFQVPAESLDDRAKGTVSIRSLQQVPKTFHKRFAVLSCPINKSHAAKAGFKYGGHTEFFEDLWASKALMFLAGPKLRIGLATNHVPINEVADRLQTKDIIKKIEIMIYGLKEVYHIEHPRIAVCGLNPHCGDGGLFGKEDEDVIRPAVDACRKDFDDCFIVGPVSADTAFFHAFAGAYDAVLAMYHDQGLAPLKLVHFDTAVNVSLGLPYLRVSPDHGPAADRFGSDSFSINSFLSAFDLAMGWLSGKT